MTTSNNTPNTDGQTDSTQKIGRMVAAPAPGKPGLHRLIFPKDATPDEICEAIKELHYQYHPEDRPKPPTDGASE